MASGGGATELVSTGRKSTGRKGTTTTMMMMMMMMMTRRVQKEAGAKWKKKDGEQLNWRRKERGANQQTNKPTNET
jgi:hypothetical protein